MRPAHILVIGGAGYLGSVITRDLLTHGYRVRVFDSFRFDRGCLDPIRSQEALEIVEGDIRCVGEVTAALDGVDAVVLLAALVGEPACDVNPKETADVNLIATKSVADASRYKGVPRFVFASTDSVYGIREGMMTEDSPKNPISLYARLKLLAEQEILELRTKAFRPTVLRMSTLYGWSPRMRFDLVVNLMALHAETRGVVEVHGGTQWRPFVHVADAAKAYRFVLEAPLDLVGGEIFNVGSDEQNLQIAALSNLMRKVWPHLRVDTIPQTPDLRDYYVRCQKIERALGYRVDWSIVDGLREIRQALQAGEVPNPDDDRYYNVTRA